MAGAIFPQLEQNVENLTTWYLKAETDFNGWHWIEKHETSIYIFAILYIAAAFLGQFLMTNRKPFKLRKSLALWNFMHGIFSLLGFLRTMPEILQILLLKDGFYYSACSIEHLSSTAQFWGLMMTFSKMVELGDTVFIVLKKKPLTFLNWGHHSLALCLTLPIAITKNTTGRWYMMMNYFVHAVMYPYFGLKTLGYKVPKGISISITAIQITQMIIGTIVAGYGLFMKLSGVECHLPYTQAYAGLIIYAMFTFIFARFFVKAYLTGSRSKVPAAKMD